MSETRIRRKAKTFPFTLYTATADCVTIPMGDMAGALLHVNTIHTASTTIVPYVCDTTNGPFVQLYDASGAAASITLAPSSNVGRAYPMPDAAFAAQFVRLAIATTAGTTATGVIAFKG